MYPPLLRMLLQGSSFLLCWVRGGKTYDRPYRLCIPYVHEVAADWTDVTKNSPPCACDRVRVCCDS